MTESPVINPAALEPLFSPHEEPYRYRAPADKKGDPAKIELGRRPSNIPIADNIRRFVKYWRGSDYPGASDTTRELLHHWFDEEHILQKKNGEGEGEGEVEQYPFRYYFCQREAIESFIYLYEVRGIKSLSSLTAEFFNDDAYDAALGVNPKDDRWPKYAFKMATGSGKTKVMSLAIVWSYFHSLYEPDSTLARDFLIIAPNITVFERLKEDFGDGKVFDSDPLIPAAWRGDWNISVSLQDGAGGAATGGTIYLTNIHRLYDLSKRKGKKEVETHDWLGPIDEAARSFIISTMKDSIPQDSKKRERFFEPDLSMLSPRDRSFHERQAKNLQRTLAENDGVMPMGLLRWCLEYRSLIPATSQ